VKRNVTGVSTGAVVGGASTVRAVAEPFGGDATPFHPPDRRDR
jgi:hypothetical protein